MPFDHSHLNKVIPLNNLKSIEADVEFPKTVLIENKCTLHIISLVNTTNESCEEKYYTLQFDEDIVKYILLDGVLWILFKSRNIVRVDIFQKSKLTIHIENYNIRDLCCDESKNLLFISESGEISQLPLTDNDIKAKIKDGVADLSLHSVKTQPRLSAYIPHANHWQGVQVSGVKDNIFLKCPITGLTQTIEVNSSVQHILPWDDVIVLAQESNMFAVNLKDAELCYTFPKIDSKYYPLQVNNGGLYYLTWEETEMHIYCSKLSAVCSSENNDHNDSSTVNYNQTSQEILKLELNSLVDLILTEKEFTEVLPKLQSYFNRFEDIMYLMKTASKLCQHDLVFKQLLYLLQSRIYKTENNKFFMSITDLIIKVELIEYISFKRSHNYDKDCLFEKNFVDLCILFISKSDMDLASICWLKYSETKLVVKDVHINALLNSVPNNIKLSTLIIWLKSFVPPLLDDNPFFIDLFVKWTMDRVFALEQSGYWPKIGLKFIEEIMNVLEISLKLVIIRPVSMDDLDILKDRICYIVELREKYKINLLLSELSTQSPSEIALIMLRRCYTEDLDRFLVDYLPSYVSRHMYDHDETLRSYIESEAASSGGGVDGIRLNILLNSFRSTTNKLECLLHVLKVLDVPWDTNVLDLAVIAAALPSKDFTVTEADRILAQEIHTELNYANVKVVLKKYNFPLSCTDYILVLNKLMSVKNVHLKDLKTITKVMTNCKSYGNMLYVDRCLYDCETRTALNYFNELPFNEKNILMKATINKYELIMESELDNHLLQKNYLDFLKGTKLLNNYQISDIENLYHLKSSYGITMCLNNFYDENFCYEKCNDWMSNKSGGGSSTPGACVSKLTRVYESRQTVFINNLRKTSANKSVREFLENFVHFNDKIKVDNITSLTKFKDGRNLKLLLNSFSCLVDLICGCDEDFLHTYSRFLSLLNTLINSNITIRNLSVTWKFLYIYLPMSSISDINDLIDLLGFNTSKISYADFKESISIKMVSIFANNTINDAEWSGENLYFDRDHLIKKIILKVIQCHEIDQLLLTCLLVVLGSTKGNKEHSWVVDILRSHSESLSPTVLNYLSVPVIRRTFSLDTDSSIGAISYPPQYLLKTKFNINFAEVAPPDSTEETWDVKVILFCVLKQHPNTHFNRLIELCRTLNISINDGLTLQLISLLSSWELKYKISNDDLNCRQINFENNEKSLISECFMIWENIKKKDLIKDILNDLWKNGEVSLHGRTVSLNPYYYEVFFCIFYLLFGTSSEMRDVKEFFLLNYLREYRRKSTPKQYEFELFSIKGMFPEVGYYRLPFHLFMREDMWSNLKSEITLETYERWLPVVALLCLDADVQTARDMICSNALKQTMTNRKRLDSNDLEGTENEPWYLTAKEEPLLRAAHKCVRHIANMEWAGACLFYVLQGCGRGADQVAAAQLCYQFAQRWAAVQPGNRAVRQMERLHTSLSTRHALYKIDWACEEFIKLSSEPAQLIRALYLHPNFVQKMSRHDVNRAANEIADKNGINISSIRIQIIENILDKPSKDNKNIKKISGLNCIELKTARYILKATCPKMGAIYLSRIAFDDESGFNKCKKLRALQCLMSVIESDTAVKVANLEREALWDSLLELVHIVNLENIDMPWVVATFIQDKIKAIEQLVQESTHIESLKIASELGRKYGNAKIIKDLVPLLLRAGLFEEMTPLLLKISSPPNELVYLAWRAVIVTPFQRADYPITERQRAKCLNAINLLPVCPVIKDIDLVTIWNNCVRCKCFGIGCLVLPYMTMQTRQSLKELYTIDKRNLIAGLKNLNSETYLVSGAMHVIENLPLKSHR